MKTLSALMFLLACSQTLFSQAIPVVRPPVANHPNIAPPNPQEPPAPNKANPYDPYGSIDGAPGSAFSDANGAAMHFLNIVDNQAYGGAWLDAGGVVQDIVPQSSWAAGMRSVRMHLGVVKTRKVSSHQTLKSLPGGLVGDFMIIKFATEFARKANTVETVTLMMHPPLGQWKVISYKIGY